MPHEVPGNDPTPNLPTNLPTDRRALLAGIGGLAAGAFIAGKANAGPLNPPAGSIAPTPGPEPRIVINAVNTPGDNDSTPSVFKITQPGSYYLTGNITLVNSKSAIEIASSGVTIDLNGYSISGVGGLVGIIVSNPSARRISIRNGYITSFLNGGIDANVADVEVDRVQVSSCGTVGIRAGSRARISHCTVDECFSNANGISVGDDSVVDRCNASENAGAGIVLGTSEARSVHASGCIANDNGLAGIRLIGSGTVADCSASSNNGAGITIEAGGVASNCSANFNTEGFNGTGGTFTACTAHQNAAKGFIVTNATLSGCVAYQNGEVGIYAGFGSTLADCTAYNNDSHGILVTFGCTVHGCTSRRNWGDGIQASSQCILLANTVSENGVGVDPHAGIRTAGGGNRVEGNHCSIQDIGIHIEGSGNVVIRNTCSGNGTNYIIAANNRYGPIINITASGTAAVSGNAAISTLASTDPHANFTH